jgi:hypothetical protein
VGRAAAASLRLFVLDEELQHVRALPPSVHEDVLERVLAWTLRWARVVEPSPALAARTTDRERLRLKELARYAGLMQVYLSFFPFLWLIPRVPASCLSMTE